MKIRTLHDLRVMGVGLGLLAAAGCASLDPDFHGADALDDATIQRMVIDRLEQDAVTANQGIGVRVEKQSATVYGSVPGDQVRARALSIVGNTPGVQSVQDELKSW